MQETFPQSYVIKTQENISYHFFLNHDKKICYQLINEDNFLIKNEILINETVIDFSVAISFINVIHLICITRVGKLQYCIGLDDSWDYKLLTELDMRSNIYRYLSLLIQNNNIHIFCLKTNLLNPMVSSIEHIYWNNKKFHKSTITSYLPGKYPSPFKIDADSVNNLYMIFKVFYKNNHQLYYSKFNFLNKKWSNTELITNPQEDHTHPFMLIDKKNNLHLVWCIIEKNNFTVKYKNKKNIINQKSTWSSPKTLSNKNDNHLSPILLQEGNLIKIYSKQNNTISEMISDNYGSSWSVVNQSKYYRVTEPMLIKYSTNYEIEKNHYKILHAYGEIDESIRLFGTKLYPQPNDNIHINKPLSLLNASNNKRVLDSREELDLDSEKNYKSNDSNHHNTADDQQTLLMSDESKENSCRIVAKDDTDLSTLFMNIEVHIGRLILELEKVQGVKKSLRVENDNYKNSIKDSVDPADYSSNKLFAQLKKIETQLAELHDEKLDIETDLDHIKVKFSQIQTRMDEFAEEFSNIYEEVMDYCHENDSFVNRIINFFR
ncbi:hypothetical protein SAMN05660297_00413 [Natronincola peptidivorans]|uniref:BNR repeat-containing family member n=1 Tax=Natronincola peptidivorans TaxID=426128 RepID=A0A1H9YUG2_9FIRM|nr:hypothetical protein [Natronincola peptidivorans]SES72809.1 hypothetical protein SAMN05660297_00413 [Natronincola peptidivorans]